MAAGAEAAPSVADEPAGSAPPPPADEDDALAGEDRVAAELEDEERGPGAPAALSETARRGRRSLLSIPDDDVPNTPSETTKSAIAAMRIVTVGDSPPDAEAPPEITDEDVEVAPRSGRRTTGKPPPKPKSIPQMKAVTAEAASEAAPASEAKAASEARQEPAPSEEEAAPDSAERVEISPESMDRMEASVSSEAEPRKKPPKPPPRRKPPLRKRERLAPPSSAESRPRQRPWWEELFGDDFARSHLRLTDKQVGQEATFIEESLGVAKGGVVLDLACGAGYHAVELASRGYGVVGYDLSLTQLALAADVAQDRGQKINFLQGDMREMAFEEMFDGVYCWNTSFGYFEEEKNVAVAERVFKALRPGGMLLLDVANRDFIVAQQPSSVWYEGDSCVCMDDMRVDFITSRLKCKRTVMLDDGRTLECNYSIRMYGLHELGKMLHDVGFRVTEASGHPATPGVFFGGSSPRIIILAERPE